MSGLKHSGKSKGKGSSNDDEGEDEDLGDNMKLNEDFLDEDWDPEKHEVSYYCTCLIYCLHPF